MPTTPAIAAIEPDGLRPPGWPWAGCVQDIVQFAAAHGVALRDLVVLLPAPQLLSVARRAWQSHSGGTWMPRFETTRSLAATLAVPAEMPSGLVSLDTALDRLAAERLLRTALPTGAARGEPAMTAPLVARLADTAQRFARALQAVAPAQRAAWLAGARTRLVHAGGPGGRELALARTALEWAALTPGYATDVLFEHRPAGWVLVHAGEVEPLAASVQAVAHERGVPALVLDFNATCAAAPVAFEAPALAVCRDDEEEAQRAAQCVLDRLAQGLRPVGLVALDRALIRRVRALLEGCRVPLADETGWTLSTTRAAATVMGLLRAAQRGATSDSLLDALKSCMALDAAAWQGVPALEQTLRRHDWRRAWRPPTLPADAAGLDLWQRVRDGLEPLAQMATLPLDDALRRLRQVLDDFALTPALTRDPAGLRVLEVLRLDGVAPGATEAARAWREALAAKRVDLAGFIAWVDDMLEGSQFEPLIDAAGGAPDVVITPLGRGVLRPFAAIVVPGADESHLGAWPTDTSLVPQRIARSLGLPGAAQAVQDEWHALALLLQQRQPLDLLRRRADATAPLAASPWLERIQLLLRQRQRPMKDLPDRRARPGLAAAPVHRPGPSWPDARLLPGRLSATGYEWLRVCPYRFHAHAGLALREVTELEDKVEKREFGQWLHDLLKRFHEEETAAARAGTALPIEATARRARLMTAAAFELEHGPWDAVAFAPYRAAFERLADRYLEWLATEEAAGWHFERAEVEVRLRPAALPPDIASRIELHGRLDRVDTQGAARRIIDYKARAKAALNSGAQKGLEDTQLLFYAVLAQGDDPTPAPLEAGYLSLDGAAVTWVEHADAAADAERLLQGVADDLGRIVRGAPLTALGEGQACERCDARGLCRRDHWSEVVRVDEASP